MSVANLLAAIAAGVLGAFAARALLPWPRLPALNSAIVGAVGGNVGADALAAIVASSRAPLAITAQSAGVDLGSILGNAALATLGGIVAMLLVSGVARLARRLARPA